MAGLDAQVQMKLVDLASKLTKADTYEYHVSSIKDILKRFDEVYKSLAKTVREEN